MAQALKEPTVGAPKPERRTANRAMLVLAVIAALVVGNTPIVRWVLYPLRLFVTFLHEACHAVAALATGGHVYSITVGFDAGGLTQSEGGWGFLIASAGYVGTALLGAAMLMWGTRPRRVRPALVLLALASVAVAIFFARNVVGVGTGLVMGIVLIAASKMRPIPMTYLYQFLAVQISLNAFSDLLAAWFLNGQGVRTDAALMAQITHVPGGLWIVVWMVISLLATYGALRYVWSGK